MNATILFNILTVLDHPFKIAAVCLFSVILFLRLLISAKIIPSFNQKSGSKLLSKALDFLFVLSFLIIILSFALEFQKSQTLMQSSSNQFEGGISGKNNTVNQNIKTEKSKPHNAFQGGIRGDENTVKQSAYDRVDN